MFESNSKKPANEKKPAPYKRKALGQHTLIDTKALHNIIKAADIKSDETVCEAGTGNGVLTAQLCARAKRVVSFEVDSVLCKNARANLAGFSNLEIINQDVFKTKDIGFDVFASNLPYSRSKAAIKWLSRQAFDRAIVMVQKEFADKLTAVHGKENYRAISVLAQTCFRIERLFVVGGRSFDPPPLVESIVLRLIPTRQSTEKFVKNLDVLFSQRNKKAISVAAKIGKHDKSFAERRVYQLIPSEIVGICDPAMAQ